MTALKFEASAPGRLDVMGGIADYSGSLVLQKPIKEKTTVKFSFRNDGIIIAKTFSKEEDESVFITEYPSLLKEGKVDFEFAKNVFKTTSGGSWAAYIVGCLLVLQKEKGIKVKGGEFEIRSEIPEGKGVSSSAALEIATMKALAKAFEIQFEGTEMAKLAQVVENQIVGAPCGLMDQLSCAYGKFGTLQPIICQPDQLLESIILPKNLYFIGIDCGTRHHVGGASYSDVRKAAFIGYSIIANNLGISVDQLNLAKRTGDKEGLPYAGFLTNISALEWANKYKELIPTEISGFEFAKIYKTTIDQITSIIPEKNYQTNICTQHPILENNRIGKFYQLLKSTHSENIDIETCHKLGELMYESHQSYTDVQLGSQGTDRLVEMVKAQEGNGVFGAKITGGGSGGTVCVLALGEKGLNTAKQIHIDYQNEIGKVVKFFS